MGEVSFYQVHVVPWAAPAVPHMMVADSRGRLRHITDSLLSILGITRAMLQATLPPVPVANTSRCRAVLCCPVLCCAVP